MFENAVFYLYVENNHSFFDPQMIERLVQDPKFELGRVIVANFDRQGRGGVPTGKDCKPAYTYSIRELLTSRRLRISMHTVGKKIEENIQKLYSQLGNWHKVIKESTQPGFTDSAISYTAKKDGENDDILIALMLSVYYGELQYRQEMMS